MFKIGDEVECVSARYNRLANKPINKGDIHIVTGISPGFVALKGYYGFFYVDQFVIHGTETGRINSKPATSEWKFKVAAIEGINWREVTRDLSRTQPVLLVHGGRRWDKEVSEDYTVQVKDELGTVTEEPRTRTWDEGHGEELRYVAISTAFLSMAKAKRLPCSLADVVHEDTDGTVFRIQGHFSAIQAWATDVNNKSWPARRRHEHTTITVSALNIGGG